MRVVVWVLVAHLPRGRRHRERAHFTGRRRSGGLGWVGQPRRLLLDAEDGGPLGHGRRPRHRRDAGATIIDPWELVCPDGTCHMIIGGTIVYADGHHLARAFARTAYPWLADQIRNALSAR
ncbi:SGNH hydrolase domain-containing protein [Microbacterium gorillae]|uniref:SGNH hydrolase domain-containing protein n=1 Tax=Microbacterium gorillae TaxID=1231063 RepID=UPI001144273D|nr:SGNH hydrolase domain-containing protein [Microbacterium gorillae]